MNAILLIIAGVALVTVGLVFTSVLWHSGLVPCAVGGFMAGRGVAILMFGD